ncbi:MAG: succinylglutamate-semialdehyde dehydrogenase [Pontibacterium sp.]
MKSVASLYINGAWCAGEGKLMHSENPANGEPIWQGKAATAQQVNDAVAAADQAFKGWAGRSFDQRLNFIRRFHQQVQSYRALLADTIGQETGKPLWEADTEVTALLNKVELSINAYQARTPDHESISEGITSRLQHRPHGIVAVFGPYNFPAHLPCGHIIPALLAGNTLVFKPSELTPRTAELLMHLWQKAELPDGVLNLVQGDRDTGAALAAQPRINGLYFTGSAATGCYLHQQFAGHPEKILALEMGGNNALLVMEVADTEAAVYQVIQSAYISAGQRCTCARRLLVPKGPAGDHFIDRLMVAIGQIKVGSYNQQPQPFMGCLISNQAAEQLLNTEQRLVRAGARILVPLTRPEPNYAFLTPGLVDVSAMRPRLDEEHFGPLLQLIRVDDLAHAISEANHTAYGLAAGVLTDNPAIFQHFDQQVRAGIINWNRPLTGASSALPFGGIGISGNHRASAWYAADYCAYPVASQLSPSLEIPAQRPPGLNAED